MPDSDESRLAREYAYGRWPEEFCSVAGLGYAPRDGGAFMEFCRSKGLDEDALFELGLLRRGDDGRVYTMFRHRIMIPIRNRWGRIIAYTARYIGNNPKAPKYLNSPNSAVYAKGECLFGIDRASRERSANTSSSWRVRLTCCVCSQSATTIPWPHWERHGRTAV